MRKMIGVWSLVGAALVAAPSSAGAISSTFDTSDEGWTIAVLKGWNTQSAQGPYDPPLSDPSLPTSPIHSSSDGVGLPAGSIYLTDPDPHSFYFQAPAAYLDKNLAGYYGGALTYFEKSSAPTGIEPWQGDPNVVLVGKNGLVLLYFKPPLPYRSINPGVDWTPFSIPLTATGWWRANPNPNPDETYCPSDTVTGCVAATPSELESVLADLNALRISGEFFDGVFETTYLDSVQVVAPVPEPLTVVLFVTGGLALLMVRRWRGRTVVRGKP